VQKALDERRLEFGVKSKQPMQVDVDRVKKSDSMYVDIAYVNVVEFSVRNYSWPMVMAHCH